MKCNGVNKDNPVNSLGKTVQLPSPLSVPFDRLQPSGTAVKYKAKDSDPSVSFNEEVKSNKVDTSSSPIIFEELKLGASATATTSIDTSSVSVPPKSSVTVTSMLPVPLLFKLGSIVIVEPSILDTNKSLFSTSSIVYVALSGYVLLSLSTSVELKSTVKLISSNVDLGPIADKTGLVPQAPLLSGSFG